MKRGTIAALAVLIGLAAYIHWFERGPVSDSEGIPIFDLDKSAITRIEIRREGEEPLVLEKGEARWKLSSPLMADTDEREVDLLLDNLETMELERVVAQSSAVDLSDFGLDEPRIEVLLRGEKDLETGLSFGSDTPTGTNGYARRLGDEEILVVASWLSNNFEKSAWDFRDKRIFHIDDELEPRRIEIRSGDREIVLEKGASLWHVVGPPRSRAESFEASGLVSDFRRAEMERIVSETGENAASYGLDAPGLDLRVHFEGEGAPVLELEVGNKETIDFYARTPMRPEIFLIEAGLVEDLQKGPDAFRSRRLFDYSTHRVDRFRIRTAAGERSFEKRESGDAESWWENTGEGRSLERTAVENLLYKLSGTNADAILEQPDLSGLGLSEPAFVITVWSEDGAREEEIRVGKPAGETVAVMRRGDEVALELTTEAWQEIETLTALEPKAQDPE